MRQLFQQLPVLESLLPRVGWADLLIYRFVSKAWRAASMREIGTRIDDGIAFFQHTDYVEYRMPVETDFYHGVPTHCKACNCSLEVGSDEIWTFIESDGHLCAACFAYADRTLLYDRAGRKVARYLTFIHDNVFEETIQILLPTASATSAPRYGRLGFPLNAQNDPQHPFFFPTKAVRSLNGMRMYWNRSADLMYFHLPVGVFVLTIVQLQARLGTIDDWIPVRSASHTTELLCVNCDSDWYGKCLAFEY